MNSIKSNVINELQKLFLKKKTIVLLIITAIVSFLCAFFISSIQQKLVFIAMGAVSFPLLILTLMANVFLPLFIFMAAAELFSGEIADRTMKLVLIRPISRLKVYASKLIALILYIVINLLVVFIVSTFSGVFLKFNVGSIAHIAFAYLVDIVPAIILAIFSAFIVQFFRSSIGALLSSILIFIGIKVLSLFIKGLNNSIFTTYLNWYSLWISGGAQVLRNINILFMLIAYGIIFFTAGYYIFDKKEF